MADTCVWISAGIGTAVGLGTYVVMSAPEWVDISDQQIAIPQETKIMYSVAAALGAGVIWYLICGGGKAVWKAATK